MTRDHMSPSKPGLITRRRAVQGLPAVTGTGAASKLKDHGAGRKPCEKAGQPRLA